MRWAVVGLLVPALGYGAQHPADLEVRASTGAIELDGRLDESAWTAATAIDDFRQVEPEQGALPSEATRVRLLFDAEHLYVGLEMQQRAAPIIANQMLQQRSIEGDDLVRVFLDPYRTGRIGYVFSTNPNAVRNEALIENSDEFDEDWEDIWQVATARDENGWSAEIAIPFRTLSFSRGEPVWAINVARHIAARNEDVAWSSDDRRIDLTTTRPVSGFGVIAPGAGVDVIAGFSARRMRDFEDRVVATRLEPSLDIFYQFTPSLTGALTLNTDFSAAEVDQREVNLTRFDLFFPEKRDFFLQDANLFEFADIEENGLPFFSRRIGRGEEGDLLDVTGGIKLSGRVGKFSVGALAVEQSLEDAPGQARLLVGRARADLDERHALGTIVTSGNPLGGWSDRLLGFDYRYQNDDLFDSQEVEAFAWWQQVELREKSNANEAWGASLAWPNDRIDARLACGVIEDDFAPPLGFVNRAGIRELSAELSYRIRPQGSWFRIFDVGAQASWIEDTAGRLQSRVLEFSPLEARNHAGDQFEFVVIDEHETLDAPFEVTETLEIDTGRYNFTRYRIEFNSALQRRGSGLAAVEWGDFYGGHLESAEASLLLAPSPQFALRLDYEHNRLRLPEGRETIRLARISAAVAFDAHWSWTNLAQYDSESRELGINSRVRWEPRAGQEVFLIFNHGRLRDEFDRFRATEREIVAKLSYVVQF